MTYRGSFIFQYPEWGSFYLYYSFRLNSVCHLNSVGPKIVYFLKIFNCLSDFTKLNAEMLASYDSFVILICPQALADLQYPNILYYELCSNLKEVAWTLAFVSLNADFTISGWQWHDALTSPFNMLITVHSNCILLNFLCKSQRCRVRIYLSLLSLVNMHLTGNHLIKFPRLAVANYLISWMMQLFFATPFHSLCLFINMLLSFVLNWKTLKFGLW